MVFLPNGTRSMADPIRKIIGSAAPLIEFIAAGAVFSTDLNDGNAETSIGKPAGILVGDTLFVWTMAYGGTAAPVEAANWAVQGPLGTRSALYMREATADANDDYSVPLNAGDTNTAMFLMRASNVLEIGVTGTDIQQTTTGWPTGACDAGADDDTMIISHGARNTPTNPVGSPFVSNGDMTLFNRIIEAGGARNIPPPPSSRIRAGICSILYQPSPVAIAAASYTPDPAFNSDIRNVLLRFRITP